MKHTQSTHTDFVIERDFAATPEAVFQAWADPQAKRRVELFASRRGTRMVYTEQLAYLDWHEDRAQRMHGTEESLD